MDVDWHNGPIKHATPVDASYRNTQAVRRFLADACGPSSSSIAPSWRGPRTARPGTWATLPTNGCAGGGQNVASAIATRVRVAYAFD